MALSVKISYHDGGALPHETVRTVTRFSRVTIGRATDCDIVLDDPKRHVSRVHAVVTQRNGEYVLSVVSKVNYVLLNGRQLLPNASATIRLGDRLEIGPYHIDLLTGTEEGVSHSRTVRMETPEPSAPRPVPRAVPARGKSLIESLAEEIPIVAPGSPAPEPRHAAPSAPEARPEPAPAVADLLRLFMEGAGMQGLKAPADRERFMRECGALLRSAIEGIIALLMARAEMKKEMRAEDRTMVSAHDNNPLKLMSDAQEVLAYLVDPQAPQGAFLAPVRAVQDACEDLRSHELALMAAMRAAIMGAIQRFDPQKIEELMSQTRSGLTLNRKAHLWDLFVAYQEKLARETEDDFNQVFASEFLGTYTAQVKRLRARR